MKLIASLIFLITSSTLFSQGWKDYFPLDEDNILQYNIQEYTDTIWVERGIENALAPRTFDFNFKVLEGANIGVGYSSRIGGADPDFNSNYPKELLQKGDSGKISIWFPGRRFRPPFVLKRKYIANTNTNKRDTLNITRVYRWKNRDTLCKSLYLGNTRMDIVTHDDLMVDDVVYLNIHQNESTSIQALEVFSKEVDINYFYLDHDGSRRISYTLAADSFSIDPNRIYTRNGRKITLEDGGLHTHDAQLALRVFSDKIIREIAWLPTIVSLHNNTEEEYSILSYLPEGSESDNTDSLYINPTMDEDDFIYTTDVDIFTAMKKKQVNVILQDNENPVDDGSLSVFCGFSGKTYINIETQYGHIEEQIRLLRIVHDLTHNK